ncbi:MAG TPA: sialidase family protein [Candidatus Acidoferrales bacterium]|nr:sialidase family protein [Candidatus Acidoferrales bacterium]
MIPLLLYAAAAAHLGPMGPEAPAREPQMAANSSMVAMAFGAGNAIYFSSSRDGGSTFAPPTKVAGAGIVPLSRHRGPRIALSGRTIVITAVAGSRPQEGAHAHGLPADGDLLVWRSQDGGTTWSTAKAINDVPGSASEGLHGLASDGGSTLFAVWLDKRGGKGTRLYSSRSSDGGVTWAANVQVYESPGGSICECCHPSAAISPGGEFVAMWRNSLNGCRDLYLATSRDGVNFPAPHKLGNGTWPLNACPMDGGGLAVSATRIVTAWRREGNVFLDEAGRPERQIGTGKDVALALSGERAYVAWVEGANVDVWIDGKVERLSSAGAFPSLTALPGGGVLAAWEEDGAVQIRRLR